MYVEPLLLYYLTELVAYGMMGGAGYLAWRCVRAYEHRSAEPVRVAALAERVQVLEEAVERAESLALQTLETQQFTTRLLLSRSDEVQRDEMDGRREGTRRDRAT